MTPLSYHLSNLSLIVLEIMRILVLSFHSFNFSWNFEKIFNKPRYNFDDEIKVMTS